MKRYRRVVAVAMVGIAIIVAAPIASGVGGGANEAPSYCGTKPVILGVADGVGSNSWSKQSFAAVHLEAAKCPNVEKVIDASAHLDTQKAISDINSMVAQGANVITVIPDAGPIASATRAALQAGVKVVAWGAVPSGGAVGPDYTELLLIDRVHDGYLFGQFVVRALRGQGNVVVLGGPAGNLNSPLTLKGVRQAFRGHPGMKILTPTPVVTNWDPALAQKAMAGLIARFPKIDAIVTEWAGSAIGAIRALQAANKPLIPVTAEDSNVLACLYLKQKKTNPKFEIATVSSGNWVGAMAFRVGMAAYQGTKVTVPNAIKQGYFENTLFGKKYAPKCDPSLPNDAVLSSGISRAELKKLFPR